MPVISLFQGLIIYMFYLDNKQAEFKQQMQRYVNLAI